MGTAQDETLQIKPNRGDPRTLTLLEENARFMRHEVFQRLVTNLRRDGVLTQWPLVWCDPEDEKRIVLSGNHRVMAAIEAGLPEIDWTEVNQYLSPDRRKALQISHNEIVGEDDPTILRRIYESIQDVEERLYSGLDDSSLDLLGTVDMDGLSEVNLSFTTMLMTFLPEEYDAAEAAVTEARKMVSPDKQWLLRYDQHNGVLDAIEDARQAGHVMNAATAFDMLLEVWNTHREDFLATWLDEDEGPKIGRRDLAPVTSLIGYGIPSEQGARVAKAIAKRRKSGTMKDGWTVLTEWANTVLGDDTKGGD